MTLFLSSFILLPLALMAAETSSLEKSSQTYFTKTMSSIRPQEAKKTTKPLTIYQKPSKDAAVAEVIGEEKNFEVTQGDWVKVTSENGATGWALASEVQEHIDNAYQNAYQITVQGTSEHYKVKKMSNEQWQKKAEEEEKRWKERMKTLKKWRNTVFNNPWFNMMGDVEDEEQVSELKASVKKLEQEIQKLQKK